MHNTTSLRIWEQWFLALGLISYSLYIWHQPLLAYFYAFLNRGLAILPASAEPLSAPIMMVIGGGIAFSLWFLLASISYQFFEKPGVELGKRFWRG